MVSTGFELLLTRSYRDKFGPTFDPQDCYLIQLHLLFCLCFLTFNPRLVLMVSSPTLARFCLLKKKHFQIFPFPVCGEGASGPEGGRRSGSGPQAPAQKEEIGRRQRRRRLRRRRCHLPARRRRRLRRLPGQRIGEENSFVGAVSSFIIRGNGYIFINRVRCFFIRSHFTFVSGQTYSKARKSSLH